MLDPTAPGRSPAPAVPRRRGRTRPRAAVAAAVLAALAACSSKSPPIAKLLEGQGSVEREHARAWAAAPNGQPFWRDDAVRTGAGAWARLRLGKSVLRMEADTLIRFGKGGPRLELGEATAEDAVVIETEAGPAQLEAGTRLRAAADPAGARYEVVIGRAVIQGGDGQVELGAGSGITVAIGGAIMERRDPKPPEPPAPPPPPPPPVVDQIHAVVHGPGASAKRGTEPWRKLPAGEVTLEAGDVVKLGRKARLELSRGNDQATVTGSADVVIGAADQPIVTARSGGVRTSARDADLAVAVPGGVVVTGTGGDASLDLTRGTARVRVVRGQATLDGTRTDAVAQAGETGILTRNGEASIKEPVPTSIDVAVPAGESATIHDPGRRVAVRVGFGDTCEGGATLELADRRGSYRDARRIAATGGAAFFAAGTTRYRLVCDDTGRVARTGTIRVRADTGAAPIVRTPPVTPLETDGRKYTVLYQNRLPGLSVRWRDAPPGPVTLHVSSGQGPERTFTGTDTVDVRAGDLPEGNYEVWMTGTRGTSQRTRLRIAFDNAAPTAQITSPKPGAAWGDQVAVAGTTVEGWTVAVDGVPVPKDGAGRFRAEVAAAGKNAFAIRLAHPQHGVHYYVRRRR